ncbi:MAG: protein veg [Tissierellia bacterium]|nr:protein veg [Tissierellia bacterium]
MTSMQLIRNELKGQIGKQVYLKADRGRKRYITRRGTLNAVYPSIFVVELEFDDSPNRMMTFTYSDILTNTVELMIVDN